MNAASTTTNTTNTTTTASAARPSASGLATSVKFKTFATVFSVCGPTIYCLCQFFNWPLVTFHPATNRLVWGYEGPRPGEGPNMLWYGWTASALILAAVIGILAIMLPERVTAKIPLNLIWILPILAIPYIVYSLMPWWVH
jgi:hypothetical protein